MTAKTEDICVDAFENWGDVVMVSKSIYIYRVAQKSKPPPIKKIALKIANEIRFIRKVKYESSTIIQSVGNKYSVRDLLL